MASPIKFGTDGWRATIAEEYTYANVRTLAAALAEYLKKHEKEKAGNGVAIGYDTRFMSAEFARTTADTIAAAGLPVQLANRDAPTPAIAWTTRSQNLATGIIITASHNPPKYNGFKFFKPNGGPADKETTNVVESLLGKKAKATQAAAVTEFDPRPAFAAQLRNGRYR